MSRHSVPRHSFSRVDKQPHPGEAMPNIQDTIEALYRAFAKNPRPRHIDGCPCCIDKNEIHVLLAKSLRAITPRELASYASSAFLTVGEVADYLYFLPRILEITATDSSWWPSPEITGRAIREANPEMWPDVQRSALCNFFSAMIGSTIEGAEYDRLDEWMCAIAYTGIDVWPFLKQIAKNPAAILGYFEQNARTLPGNKLTNNFWELPCPGHDAIVDWFFSPEISKIPFDGYGCLLKRAD